MFVVILYFVLTVIGFAVAIPITNQSETLTYLDAITNYFSALTLIGCLTGVITIITRLISKHKFNPLSKTHSIPKWEQKIYALLHTSKWGRLTPDLGRLVGFKKVIDFSKIKSSSYCEKFLYENFNASCLHLISIFVSPLIYLILEEDFYLSLGLPILLISFFLNIIPVMIQRSLRPKLNLLYKSILSKEERKNRIPKTIKLICSNLSNCSERLMEAILPPSDIQPIIKVDINNENDTLNKIIGAIPIDTKRIISVDTGNCSLAASYNYLRNLYESVAFLQFGKDDIGNSEIINFEDNERKPNKFLYIQENQNLNSTLIEEFFNNNEYIIISLDYKNITESSLICNTVLESINKSKVVGLAIVNYNPVKEIEINSVIKNTGLSK